MRALVYLSLVLILGACAKDINSSNYSENSVGEVSATYHGVIVSARDVLVTGGDNIEDNKVGGVVGGVAGGLAGNQFGKGSGRTAATVGGALLGAAAGAFAESELSKQGGVEYVVRLSGGELRTVVQGPEPRFGVNQPVFLLIGTNGRSRIIPDYS